MERPLLFHQRPYAQPEKNVQFLPSDTHIRDVSVQAGKGSHQYACCISDQKLSRTKDVPTGPLIMFSLPSLEESILRVTRTAPCILHRSKKGGVATAGLSVSNQ